MLLPEDVFLHTLFCHPSITPPGTCDEFNCRVDCPRYRDWMPLIHGIEEAYAGVGGEPSEGFVMCPCIGCDKLQPDPRSES